MENYYEILGLTMNATQKEIKSAYREIVKKYHPDVNPNPEAEKIMKGAGKAYAILGDEKQKEKYDAMLMSKLENAMNDIFSELDEVFKEYEDASEELNERIKYYDQKTEETRSFLNQLREELDEMDDEDLFQDESTSISRKKKRFFWRR